MAVSMSEVSAGMAALVAQSSPTIVRVEGRRRLAASGVIWSADGVIVTANHVVERDEEIQVGLPDGSIVAATVVGRDPGIDLAVLRVPSTGSAAAEWLESSELKVGHIMLALGRPGQSTQATLGIVSALGGEWRSHAGGTLHAYLQTDVVMYPGFSGGPLVAADGRFAGMNTSGLTRGVSVTVPTETLRRAVETILTHGHVPRGYLGIGVQPVRLTDALQEQVNQEFGLMVMSVEANGPAAQAGLMQGDVLLKLGETPVHHVDALQAVLRSAQVGEAQPVQLLRGGALQQIAVTIGSAA
ncbi:MAG: trypsin-like peptidase domain-containing protein [Caldilineaceae bacterium]|nr:trypsin-like peptidase domain-containing protein [Caldilineaceae bacterium]